MVEIHLTTVVSVVSLLIAALSFLLTQLRLRKADTKDSSAEIENLKVRLKSQEETGKREQKTIDENTLAIERHGQELRSVNRRLDAIDALKIDANLAGIQTELKHIRALLEKR